MSTETTIQLKMKTMTAEKFRYETHSLKFKPVSSNGNWICWINKEQSLPSKTRKCCSSRDKWSLLNINFNRREGTTTGLVHLQTNVVERNRSEDKVRWDWRLIFKKISAGLAAAIESKLDTTMSSTLTHEAALWAKDHVLETTALKLVHWNDGLDIPPVVSKILKTSINVSDDILTTAATFINFNTLACRVSPHTSYAIAVSNNGRDVSRYYNHFVFNSSCVTCSLASELCSLAQDTCFISNICYSFDQLSPDNGSESCQPSLSQTMFTTTQRQPRVTSSPTMSVSVNSSSNYTQFTCSFRALQRNDVSYFVDIYYGKKYLLNLMLQQEGDVLVAHLSEDDIDILRFTQKIFCTVSVCVTANCNSTRGPARTSNILTAGIQIIGQTGGIQVYEGTVEGFILVSTSLPPHLYCLREDRGDCYIRIYTSLLLDKNEVTCPSGQRISQLVFPISDTYQTDGACSHRLTMATWTSVLRIPVQGTVDQLKDGDQVRQVQVMATTVTAGLEFDTSLVGQATIVVKDRDSTRRPCQSVGDPHIRSFDGKTYNNYFQGEFILVKHKTLPIEVRTLQHTCKGKAACSCGLVVKFWDDVIVLDRCQAAEGDLGQPLVPKLYFNGNLTEGTRLLLLEDGSYQIHLPTGMIIQAHPATNGAGAGRHDSIDIYVLASSADFEQTEGLCGTYDDDESNDFLTMDGKLVQSKNEFILTWRVTEAESIYSGVCPTDVVSIDTHVSCDCTQGRKSYCSPTAAVQTCQNTILGAEDITNNVSRTVRMDACIAARDPAQWSYNLNYTYSVPEWMMAVFKLMDPFIDRAIEPMLRYVSRVKTSDNYIRPVISYVADLPCGCPPSYSLRDHPKPAGLKEMLAKCVQLVILEIEKCIVMLPASLCCLFSAINTRCDQQSIKTSHKCVGLQMMAWATWFRLQQFSAGTDKLGPLLSSEVRGHIATVAESVFHVMVHGKDAGAPRFAAQFFKTNKDWLNLRFQSITSYVLDEFHFLASTDVTETACPIFTDHIFSLLATDIMTSPTGYRDMTAVCNLVRHNGQWLLNQMDVQPPVANSEEQEMESEFRLELSSSPASADFNPISEMNRIGDSSFSQQAVMEFAFDWMALLTSDLGLSRAAFRNLLMNRHEFQDGAVLEDEAEKKAVDVLRAVYEH